MKSIPAIGNIRTKWPSLLAFLWFAVPPVLTLIKFRGGPGSYNNYLIYKHVFWNVVQQHNLYDFYPGLYLYQNHYGPTFSMVIAPFALLPDALGMIFWSLANAAVLFYAIRKLPMQQQKTHMVMAIVVLEMFGSIQSQQFNPMLCGWIILSFVFLMNRNAGPAAFFIASGLLVKLYGIVGLAFTPFTGKYRSMTIWMLIALVVLVCIPMLYSDPHFVLQSYADWYHRLVGKNRENIMTNLTDGMQDISFMGMVRRMTGWYGLPNSWFLLPAGLLTLLPMVKRNCFGEHRYRMFFLAQVLIGVVIFSTSAESPTYIIAVTGFAIWYAALGDGKSVWMKALLGLLFLLTILSSTDLFPASLRNAWVKPYALKALPCVLAWLVITWQLLWYRPKEIRQSL